MTCRISSYRKDRISNCYPAIYAARTLQPETLFLLENENVQLFEVVYFVVYYEERKTVRVYVPVPVFFAKKGSLPVVPVQVMKLAGYSVSLARYLFGQQGIRENQYPVIFVLMFQAVCWLPRQRAGQSGQVSSCYF